MSQSKYNADVFLSGHNKQLSKPKKKSIMTDLTMSRKSLRDMFNRLHPNANDKNRAKYIFHNYYTISELNEIISSCQLIRKFEIMPEIVTLLCKFLIETTSWSTLNNSKSRNIKVIESSDENICYAIFYCPNITNICDTVLFNDSQWIDLKDFDKTNKRIYQYVFKCTQSQGESINHASFIIGILTPGMIDQFKKCNYSTMVNDYDDFFIAIGCDCNKGKGGANNNDNNNNNNSSDVGFHDKSNPQNDYKYASSFGWRSEGAGGCNFYCSNKKTSYSMYIDWRFFDENNGWNDIETKDNGKNIYFMFELDLYFNVATIVCNAFKQYGQNIHAKKYHQSKIPLALVKKIRSEKKVGIGATLIIDQKGKQARFGIGHVKM